MHYLSVMQTRREKPGKSIENMLSGEKLYDLLLPHRVTLMNRKVQGIKRKSLT